jgi:hypothetical protein
MRDISIEVTHGSVDTVPRTIRRFAEALFAAVAEIVPLLN